MPEIQSFLNFSAPGPYHIRGNKLYAGDIELLSASSKYGLPLLELLSSGSLQALQGVEVKIAELEKENHNLKNEVESYHYDVEALEDEVEDLKAEVEDLKAEVESLKV